MPMPDLTAMSALTSSLKATADIAKLMMGIRDEQLIREKAIELTAVVMAAQSGALAAQAAHFELLDRVRDLESQVVELEDWDRQKQRYELAEIATGVFAYATKPGMEAGEPPHKICAGCYQHRRKSILQSFGKADLYATINMLVCHACKAEIIESTTHHSLSDDAVPTAGRDRSLW